MFIISIFRIQWNLGNPALWFKFEFEEKVTNPKTQSYGEIINFKKENILHFPDFTLTFNLEKKLEEYIGVKSPLEMYIRHFTIENDKLRYYTEIIHGQSPPSNEVFEFGDSIFIIYTHITPSGEILFPDSLMITKN